MSDLAAVGVDMFCRLSLQSLTAQPCDGVMVRWCSISGTVFHLQFC